MRGLESTNQHGFLAGVLGMLDNFSENHSYDQVRRAMAGSQAAPCDPPTATTTYNATCLKE